MMTTSAFEILGPIMVGPSSSHTAGALRLASVARTLAPGPIKHATFTLYNSFSATYKGHGTDRALVAGLLGLSTFDTRIKTSFDLARESGMDFEFVEAGSDAGLHPNTVTIEMLCEGGRICVQGQSLGGGRIKLSQINGIEVEISGEWPTIFLTHEDKPGVLASLTSLINQYNTNIASMRNYRKEQGGLAYTIFETDEMPRDELIDQMRHTPYIHGVNVVKVPGATSALCASRITYAFENGKELAELCEKHNMAIGQIMRKREYQLSGGAYDVDKRMTEVIRVMREETRQTISRPERSLGGMLFGQAKNVYETPSDMAHTLLGSSLTNAVAYAMAVLERSASMGVIVASPTAGSAGVVPGALLAAFECANKSEEELAEALWCACAIGAIIARNASVAGAEGGCQAEVGSASAMAAAALTELMGGSLRQAFDAASIAISNLLGLVCDPVQGLVEYPCQDRNAIGVSNAYTAAQLSLSGVLNPIPFDEVVDAMRKVGVALPEALRETAQGGLAATPSAQNGSCSACFTCSGCCR